MEPRKLMFTMDDGTTREINVVAEKYDIVREIEMEWVKKRNSDKEFEDEWEES